MKIESSRQVFIERTDGRRFAFTGLLSEPKIKSMVSIFIASIDQFDLVLAFFWHLYLFRVHTHNWHSIRRGHVNLSVDFVITGSHLMYRIVMKTWNWRMKIFAQDTYLLNTLETLILVSTILGACSSVTSTSMGEMEPILIWASKDLWLDILWLYFSQLECSWWSVKCQQFSVKLFLKWSLRLTQHCY